MTGKCVYAHTNLDPTYPGYVNFTREDDGTVSLYVRGDPKPFDGTYVCGFERDRGSAGRCTPGDDCCNNYCNMAPAKGPMQPHPKDCKQVECAEVVKLTLSAADFDALVAGLSHGH